MKDTHDKIAFIHIPKCGGNSVKHALFDHFKTEEIYGSSWEGIYSDKPWDEYKCICWHLNYKTLFDSCGFKFTTILRHPVDRVVSNANFLVQEIYKRPDIQKNHEEVNVIQRDLDYYIDFFVEDNVYVKHLERHRGESDYEKAIHAFDLIGFLDDIDGYIKKLGELIGVELNLYKDNVSEKTIHFTEAQRNRIAARVKNDMAVWHYARSVWKH